MDQLFPLLCCQWFCLIIEAQLPQPFCKAITGAASSPTKTQQVFFESVMQVQKCVEHPLWLVIYFPPEAVPNVIFLNTRGGGGSLDVFYESTKIAGFYDSWIVSVCSAYVEEDVLLKYR